MTEPDSPRPDTPAPVSVRAVMGEAAPSEEPSVRLELDDETWIVRSGGASTSGGSSPARSQLITFARETDPEKIEREVIVPGAPPEERSPDELEALLLRSRPFRGRGARAELFEDTRTRRKR